MSDPSTLGRNDPCHCGSGKKYKQCHLVADEAAARELRQKAQAKAEAEATPAPEAENAGRPAPNQAPRHGGAQPWKRSSQNTRGFAKVSATRKVGSG